MAIVERYDQWATDISSIDRQHNPKEEDHKIAHRKLFEKVGEFKKRFETGDMSVADDLLMF